MGEQASGAKRISGSGKREVGIQVVMFSIAMATESGMKK
jgi:hypothetical protein